MDAAVSDENIDRSLTDLADEITTIAGHVNAVNYRWLTLIAEFDRRQGWSDGATQSCAHWLNWKCGIDTGAAREKVRVAHALEGLPRISAAMEKGELSYSKVRALTRVACTNTEEYLLEIALHGTAGHVEKLVRHFRRAKEAEELSRETAQQLNRACTYAWDEDGSLLLKARLPVEAGAMVLKALEAADPAAKVVYVSAETLRDSEAGRCEIEEGPGICAETCRRLACDCSLVHITEGEHGSVLDVGRKTRSIPPALRRALNARDQGCRFPGCCNSKYLDGHHIEHWANGAETKLRNLVSLCRFHHRHVHEGGVTVQILDDGALRFLRSDGQRLDGITPVRPKPFVSRTRIDAQTAVTRWRGEKMNYCLGVEVLLQQAKRPRRPSQS